VSSSRAAKPSVAFGEWNRGEKAVVSILFIHPEPIKAYDVLSFVFIFYMKALIAQLFEKIYFKYWFSTKERMIVKI